MTPLPQGLSLSDKEAMIFAYRVVLRQLSASDMWLDWEDYPYLSEQAFNDMDRHVQVTTANYLREHVRSMEVAWQIDGAALMEEAT